jgi:hypothetical protein
MSVSQERSCALTKREHRDKRRGPKRGPRTSREPHDEKRTVEMRPSATELLVRPCSDGSLEFVCPRCAAEREDDVRAAQEMFAKGETDVARDELRWLLQGCSDNMTIHLLLGEIAAAENDYVLARGHFGYAYQIGQRAIRRSGLRGILPVDVPANRSFFTATKGLVHSLVKLDKRKLAEEVVEFLLECDPRDPLRVREVLASSGASAD